MKKEDNNNQNEINNTEKNNKSDLFLNKVFKFITKEKREIIGCLKAYNKQGNFYLIDCVELFDKNSDHFATNELFQNNDEHKFYYESDHFQYQYLNNCVIPLEEIGDIYMLKDEIFNKYQSLIDKYLEEKRLKEEQQKKEEEIYNQWKDMIKIGEEGEGIIDFSDENVINEFLNYIKIRKVVSLEDLSGVFKISPNELVEKLNQFENEGRILGIIDDRGKYIYVTEKEMNMIENLFMKRGRINKGDLIKECNKIIKFEPTEENKIKIAQEQKEMLEKIESELNIKK